MGSKENQTETFVDTWGAMGETNLADQLDRRGGKGFCDEVDLAGGRVCGGAAEEFCVVQARAGSIFLSRFAGWAV